MMAQGEHTPVQTTEGAPDSLGDQFTQLVAVVERLRSETGCPWDRQQTPESLLPYLLEEAYEVMESITAGDASALREELGDLLLHVVFQGCLAEEAGRFKLADSLQTVIHKLTERHPHVFGDQQIEGTSDVRRRWESAKRREKGRASLLDGVPRTLPALNRARRVQEKAASVGFDWPRVADVWAKVREELGELEDACVAENTAAVREELGDLLFSLVNLGRFLQLSAEDALREATGKFEFRFRGIEQELARRGLEVEQATLQEMDDIWNRLRREGKHV